MEKPTIQNIRISGSTFSGYVINNIFYSVNGRMGINLADLTTFRIDTEMKEYILNLNKHEQH